MFDTTAQTVRVLEGGTITIPAAYRQAMGIATGDIVVLELIEGDLRVRPLAASIREAQAIVRSFVPKDRHLADELIAERRAESAPE